ncbi:hypothetical protein Tco_1365205 [Tanacetum coccineum]
MESSSSNSEKRVENVETYGQYFMEEIMVKRANEKANIFSKSDYKYLNKNDIEDMCLLCLKREVDHKNRLLNSLIVFIESYVIWEGFMIINWVLKATISRSISLLELLFILVLKHLNLILSLLILSLALYKRTTRKKGE